MIGGIEETSASFEARSASILPDLLVMLFRVAPGEVTAGVIERVFDAKSW
jgi:hypothetical protein